MVRVDNSPFDYHAFWAQVWDHANRTHTGLAAQSARQDRQPCVFIYDQLPKPFSDWNVTAPTAFREAFGQPLKSVGSVQIRDTSGYAFGAMLHYRLCKSQMYRTHDPSRADLFFVPMITAPKRHRALRKACAAIRASLHNL